MTPILLVLRLTPILLVLRLTPILLVLRLEEEEGTQGCLELLNPWKGSLLGAFLRRVL